MVKIFQSLTKIMDNNKNLHLNKKILEYKKIEPLMIDETTDVVPGKNLMVKDLKVDEWFLKFTGLVILICLVC